MNSKSFKPTMSLYFDSIEMFQPFNGIRITPVMKLENTIEECDKEHTQFYGIYGHSEKDSAYYLIGGAVSLNEAVDLAKSLNIISNWCLVVYDYNGNEIMPSEV